MVLALSPMAFGQATPPPPTDETTPHGKVLFSRDQDSPETEKPAKTPAKHAIEPVTDAERSALTFTAYDLDVHLVPAQSHLEVHAGFTVRNSGKEPLTRLAAADLLLSPLGELCPAERRPRLSAVIY